MNFVNTIMQRDPHLICKKVDRGIFLGYQPNHIHSEQVLGVTLVGFEVYEMGVFYYYSLIGPGARVHQGVLEDGIFRNGVLS